MRDQTSLLKGTPILYLKYYKSNNQTTVTTVENTGMNNIDNIKCTRFKHLQKVLVSSFCHFIESNEATEYLSLFSPNRSFAPCHSRGTKPPSWDAKVALGQDKQRKLPFKIMYAFCSSCLSANFASQHGGFVPRVWQAAKGLYLSFNHCVSSPPLPQIACSVKYGQL